MYANGKICFSHLTGMAKKALITAPTNMYYLKDEKKLLEFCKMTHNSHPKSQTRKGVLKVDFEPPTCIVHFLEPILWK